MKKVNTKFDLKKDYKIMQHAKFHMQIFFPLILLLNGSRKLKNQ